MITDYFDNHPDINYFYASATDLKNEFFPNDHGTGLAWIMRILKRGFNMQPLSKVQRYIKFETTISPTKTGTPYKFLRKDFTGEPIKDPF